MRAERKNQAGFSLAEMLVVVAIIGIMSLVLVPQFVSFQHSAKLKGAMRNFNADLRNARQVAISRYWQVRVEFSSPTSYSFYQRPANSADSVAWTSLTQEQLTIYRISGAVGNTKFIQAPMRFSANSFNDLDGNSLPDVIFNSDGSVIINTPTDASPKPDVSITIASPWKNIAENQMIVTVYPSGRIAAVGAHS